MRKFLAWILAALCALLPTVGIAAENSNTQLITTLPREHTIQVVCGADGAVLVNGMAYTGTHEFIVDRLSAFVLEAVPDAGYRLSQAMVHPSRGVSIAGNTICIDSVYEDKTLTLSFVRQQTEPTPTPIPTTTPTATPTATPTSTAEPTPTVSPTEASAFALPYVESQGNVLYDNYLGTGNGLSELGIVCDETYGRDEYQLLAALYDEDQANESGLLVIAQPNEDDTYVQRSLMMSGLQLVRLWQEKDIQWLELRNGNASALMGLEELVTGNTAKLVHMLASNVTVAALSDLEAQAEVTLSVEELADITVEVRIVPPSATQDGYKMNVYLWDGNAQVCITELLASFQVGLTADELAEDATREDYLQMHALGAVQEDETIFALQSALLHMPMETSPEETDTAEYFEVSFETEDNGPVVLYDSVIDVETYRRYALYAPWPGDMAVCILQTES